jgi:hypothetical protein
VRSPFDAGTCSRKPGPGGLSLNKAMDLFWWQFQGATKDIHPFGKCACWRQLRYGITTIQRGTYHKTAVIIVLLFEFWHLKSSSDSQPHILALACQCK